MVVGIHFGNDMIELGDDCTKNLEVPKSLIERDNPAHLVLSSDVVSARSHALLDAVAEMLKHGGRVHRPIPARVGAVGPFLIEAMV